MIKLLRQHLFKNVNLISMLEKSDGLFHVEKPPEREDKTYIVIKDKLLSDYFIEQKQLDFYIVSPNLQKVIDMEKELVNYLNDPRGEKVIKNDDTYIRNIQVLNGGGKTRTPEGDFMVIVRFKCSK